MALFAKLVCKVSEKSPMAIAIIGHSGMLRLRPYQMKLFMISNDGSHGVGSHGKHHEHHIREPFDGGQMRFGMAVVFSEDTFKSARRQRW